MPLDTTTIHVYVVLKCCKSNIFFNIVLPQLDLKTEEYKITPMLLTSLNKFVTGGKSRASKEDLLHFTHIGIKKLVEKLQVLLNADNEKLIKVFELDNSLKIHVIFKNLEIKRKKRGQNNLNLFNFRLIIVESIMISNLPISSCTDASDLPFNGCSFAKRRRRKKKFIDKDTGE